MIKDIWRIKREKYISILKPPILNVINLISEKKKFSAL